ncbi:hypothetical protein CC79DRAFT_1328291 [Sarocladium strictum]
MAVTARHRYSSRDLSPAASDGTKKLCILIACISAPMIIFALYKVWQRKRRSRDTTDEPPPYNEVRHINPAEFMRFCALREQRRAESEAKRLVPTSHLDAVAPISLYSNLSHQETSSSTSQSSIQKPRPTFLAGSFQRWNIWSNTATAAPETNAESSNGSCRSWDQCSICLGGFGEADAVRRTKCDHVFHAGCLERWLTEYRGRCPLCQKDFGLAREDNAKEIC